MSKRDKIELKELESLPEALDGNHRVIPIVTGEDDTVEEVAVPEILPVLTLRSSVLFPGAITPVTVGRSRSMTLVRELAIYAYQYFGTARIEGIYFLNILIRTLITVALCMLLGPLESRIVQGRGARYRHTSAKREVKSF